MGCYILSNDESAAGSAATNRRPTSAWCTQPFAVSTQILCRACSPFAVSTQLLPRAHKYVAEHTAPSPSMQPLRCEHTAPSPSMQSLRCEHTAPSLKQVLSQWSFVSMVREAIATRHQAVTFTKPST